jgi:putative spermidine/putrescine transport system substrate-binding protein
VLSAPPELAGELIDQHKVAALTTSDIPGYEHVAARLRGLPSVERDGRVYGVPYLWGFHQVLYDTGKVGRKRAASGWAGLLAGPGPVALPDSPMTIADAALALKGGLRPADPYELTPEQLDAAMALLARHKGSGRIYWRLDLQVIEGFGAGRLKAAQALPYHQVALKRAGRPVRAAEQARTTGWADAWMVSAETERPTCAYQWIGYMTSTRVQRQAAAWTGLAPAVPAACGGDARRVCEAYDVKGVLGKGTKAFRRIAFAVRPRKDCGGAEGECTDYAQWTERWHELVK